MGLKDYSFRGKTYAQWELNEEIVTGARTITETDVVNFAGLSGDWSATHTNEIYGKNTIYGQRIVYGNVTFIVATGLLSQTLHFEGTAAALMSMKVSYHEPVLFGDTIFCKFSAVEKALPCHVPGYGKVGFHVFVYNQEEKQVAEIWLSLLIALERPVMA